MASKINVNPKHHDLKIAPEHFRNVCLGLKTAEYRRNDRNFEQFDIIRLREYDNGHTGNEVSAVISHVLDLDEFHKLSGDEFQIGYVVLSIQLINGSRKCATTELQ
ncbi:RNA-binding protein [Enterobacter phage Ec_L1]|uniref:DUF3850 domain-containing protein n=1 Tax=Enterobacter phage Ec_L1 TaxID=2070180 RepID=A0A2P0W9X8_9CAUD|nr:RNA-binding protein [Enterobacter phage Ec_L1]AUV57157.1 hypothetical protein Ec43 [Enterobacter phage Ec_L1]